MNRPLPSRTLRHLGQGLLVAVAMILAHVRVAAQATDLIISEYVEGSVNNKFLELYNGTASAANLANYELRLYANGSTSPTSATLSGTLASGATIVYANSGATAGLYPDPVVILNSVVNFNGDDAIALYRTAAPVGFVDIIGQIGCDPGTQWTAAGGLSTLDHTLVRNTNICSGVSVNPTGTCGIGSFPTLASDWTVYPQDDVSHLGSHDQNCGPTVTFSTASNTSAESVGTITVNMNIFPATTATSTITFSVANGAGVVYGLGGDYTTTPSASGGTFTITSIPVGTTSLSFPLSIVNDIASEATETFTFSITGASGNLYVGSANTYAQTITDDDFTPTVNFSTTPVTVLESVPSQVFTMSIIPSAAAGGTVLIQVTDGPGAVYGTDYTTTPAVSGGYISIPFSTGATSVSFTASIIQDAVQESSETVTFTIAAVPAGMTTGSSSTSSLTIGDDDTPATVLARGDIFFLGINANNNCASGNDDEISFVCFKDITPGTTIDMTDCGYERCFTGEFGDTEGAVRATRSGATIPAGKVITFRYRSSGVVSVAPDAGWTFSALNGALSALNLSTTGDQLFFMQSASLSPWTNTVANDNHATYSGTILCGFSTNATFPWSQSCLSVTNSNTSGTCRSNLPVGLDCFSMAQTSGTNYAKYTGPTSTASQRDWILRLSTVTNWTNYANCTGYSNTGPDWLSSPLLLITPGTMVAGKWTGIRSSDWFQCGNWDDVQVPVAATAVTMDQSGTNDNCIVGITAGSPATAQCASLAISSNNTDVPLLAINNGKQLVVSGAASVSRTAVGFPTGIVVNSGSFTSANLTLTGSSAGARDALFRDEVPANTVQMNGHVIINNGGLLDLQGGSLGGTLSLTGNYANNDGPTALDENFSNIRFNGSGSQSITTVSPEPMSTLTVNKSVGQLTLNSPVSVSTALNLAQGIVANSASSVLTVGGEATVIGASNLSFVNGPVEKIGNTDFNFPIGKGVLWRPAQLSNINGGVTDAFRAEYFLASPQTTYGPAHDAGLHHVSDCEYWIIERSSGIPDASVSLTWNSATSCGVTVLADMRVARWDGTQWTDKGNGGFLGNTAAGAVITSAVQTQFSPWTLASVNANNPLPIELLKFTAYASGARVNVEWTTASEKNNDHFTVERSADGVLFEEVTVMPGAGNSQGVLNYGCIDPTPLGGLSYYRLRQTDFDGTTTTSDMVPVFFNDRTGTPLTVINANEVLYALHGAAAGSTLDVLDLTGRVVKSTTVGGELLSPLAVDGLTPGVYVLRLSNGSTSQSTRFVR